MSKAAKPTALLAKHLTSEEKRKRKEQEKKLQGNSDLVYKTPLDISQDEADIYNFLTKELKESGILNNLDITILKTCANAIYMMEDAARTLRIYGSVQQKDDGTFVKHPSTTIYKDYNAIFNKCCMELGLSPSARAKLSVLNVKKQEEAVDPVLVALRGGKK